MALKGKKITFNKTPQEYVLLQDGLCGECQNTLYLNLDKNYAFCLFCKLVYKWSQQTDWKKFNYSIHLPSESCSPKNRKRKTGTNK